MNLMMGGAKINYLMHFHHANNFCKNFYWFLCYTAFLKELKNSIILF